MFLRFIIIARYLFTVTSAGKYHGDYLNDWLSHLDHQTAAQWEAIGHAIARLIGAA